MSISVQFQTQSTTADNYHVKLKGNISYQSTLSKGEIVNELEKVIANYFRNISLLDALRFFENKKQIDLQNFITNNLQRTNIGVEEFVLTTIDAVEVPTKEKIEYAIDPNLETGKKKKGLFGRFKR